MLVELRRGAGRVDLRGLELGLASHRGPGVPGRGHDGGDRPSPNGGRLRHLDDHHPIGGPAHAFADALTTFDGTVADLEAGGRAGAAVGALVGDDEMVIADLNSVGGQTGATFLSWRSQTEADGRRATAASDTVRAALGLPPATAG